LPSSRPSNNCWTGRWLAPRPSLEASGEGHQRLATSSTSGVQGFGGFSSSPSPFVHPSSSPHPIVFPRSSPSSSTIFQSAGAHPHRPRSLHRAPSELGARVDHTPPPRPLKGDWESGLRTTPITIPKAIAPPPYTITSELRTSDREPAPILNYPIPPIPPPCEDRSHRADVPLKVTVYDPAPHQAYDPDDL
jgi:hypothetical protein